MDATLICSEDEDLVIRIRQTGLTAHRLPLPMTLHDADLHRFSAFWRRAVRAGHGFAAVGRRHPGHFRPERRRALWTGLLLPLLTLALLPVAPVWALLIFAAVNALGITSAARWLRGEGVGWADAWRGGLVTHVSRLAHLIGMATFWRRHLAGGQMQIIEYK